MTKLRHQSGEKVTKIVYMKDRKKFRLLKGTNVERCGEFVLLRVFDGISMIISPQNIDRVEIVRE